MLMRAGAAGLIAVATLMAVPTPSAADEGRNITSFGFTVSPSSVSPGDHVRLNATGCELPSVKVSSAVFDDTVLNEGRSATVRVYEDARPGAQYQVTFDCKGEKGTTTLTISGAPHRGVKAGEGGASAALGGWTGTGTALLAAGLLGGAYVLRRKTRDSA
ncbi:hypothetical protein SAVIM338S_00912 [Streptomyces avidinii]